MRGSSAGTPKNIILANARLENNMDHPVPEIAQTVWCPLREQKVASSIHRFNFFFAKIIRCLLITQVSDFLVRVYLTDPENTILRYIKTSCFELTTKTKTFEQPGSTIWFHSILFSLSNKIMTYSTKLWCSMPIWSQSQQSWNLELLKITIHHG